MAELLLSSDNYEKLTEQTHEAYFIRRGITLVKRIIPETEYDILTFKHFFSKLLKLYKHLDLTVSKDSFRIKINLNLNVYLKNFYGKIPLI